MIISDFDKTLTKKDTLYGLIICLCQTRKHLYILIPFYWIVAVLYKIRLISNTKMKEYFTYLFFKHLSVHKLNELGEAYSSKIDFSPLYYELLNSSKKVVVITASFDFYIKYCIPSHWKLHASELEIKDEIVTKLKRNLYGNNKGCLLSKYYNLKYFDEAYTDSLSDYSIFQFAKKVFIMDSEFNKKQYI